MPLLPRYINKRATRKSRVLYGKPVATFIKLLTEEFMLCERLDVDKVIPVVTQLGGKLLTLEYMEYPLAPGSVEAGTNTDDSVDGDEVSSDPSSTTNSIPPFLFLPEVPPHDSADDDIGSDDEPDAKVKKEKGNETPEVGGSKLFPEAGEPKNPKKPKNSENLLVPSETAIVEERGAPEVTIDKTVKPVIIFSSDHKPVDEEVSDTEETTPKSVPKEQKKWAEVKIPDKPLITSLGSFSSFAGLRSSKQQINQPHFNGTSGGSVLTSASRYKQEGGKWVLDQEISKPVYPSIGSSSSFAGLRHSKQQNRVMQFNRLKEFAQSEESKPTFHPEFEKNTEGKWVRRNRISQPKVDS